MHYWILSELASLDGRSRYFSNILLMIFFILNLREVFVSKYFINPGYFHINPLLPEFFVDFRHIV